MSIARTIVKRATRKAWVRVMNRAGSLLGRVVDTSADAPAASFAPKRDVYRAMQEGPSDHDHDHDHAG